MIFFLLADSEIWYIWPETNASTVLQVLIFIFLFILVIQVARLIFLRKKTTSSSWTHILSYAYNKKLTAKEITVVEHFFNTLDLSVSEKANLLNHKKSFQSHLYAYLKKYHSESVESYVRILDKLFPTPDSNLEIKSILDVHVGEACAIEIDGLYFLAKVMSKNETDVLLSLDDSALRKEHEGVSINLYFYREILGGCLIPGVIKKISNNGILFSQEGDIQTKGEEHLVADLTRDVELAPWGLNLDSNLSLHNSSEPIQFETEDGLDELNSSGMEQQPSANIKGSLIKLSDRAALITVTDPFFNSALLRKIDIWEMILSISPGSPPLILRGKILRSDSFSESYIFKFVAPSEFDTKQIFEEIKKHSPVRGFIS